MKIFVTASLTCIPLQFFGGDGIKHLIFLLKLMKNIFVPQNNCGQEYSKVGKKLCCCLKNSGFVLMKWEILLGLCAKGLALKSVSSHNAYN